MFLPFASSTAKATVQIYINGKAQTEEEVVPEKIRYIAAPGLPVSRAIGFPHVVDTLGFDEDTETEQLTLADGISTFLWNWDQKQFHNFFNFSCQKFEIWYSAPGGLIKDMLICRRGRNVMAGFRPANGCEPPEPQLIYLIDRHGKWTGRACTEAPHAIEWYGSVFAKAIICHELWDLKKWNAKVRVYHSFDVESITE